MKNNIDWQINTLNEIAKWWIKEDKFHHEFKDVIDTLESIKEEISKWWASKDQLKKIIDFLRQQIRTIPDGNFVMSNRLNSYKQDFKKILNNLNHETNSINNKSKTEINKILDEAIANWQITDETNKNKKEVNHIINNKIQNNFSNNWKQTFESILDLNNLTSYTVRSGDNLWNIVKKQYPSLTQSNKDIIHIINYIVNLNTKLEPKRLRHLMTDNKLAWGKKWSDWIAWDTLRIGDILKFPKIKTIKEEITTPKVVIEKKEEKENPELIKEKKVLIIKASEIENEEVKNKILKEINECKTKECLNKIRDDINKLIAKQESVWTIETRSYFKTVWFTQNWENYIIWKDWEPKLITTQELTPEYKEALKEYKETLLLTENINLLLSALSQNWEDVSKFNTQLKNKINSFNPLELKKSVNEIKTTINSIFNNLDIDNKKEIDLKSTISVYKYIRDELDNYELVRKQIAEKEFNNLTKISQEELDAFIKNPLSNQEKIKNILWEEWFKDFQKEISEKKAEANTYYIDHQEELKEQFPNLDIESIQSLVINSFVWSYSKIALMEAYIEKNMMKENSFIWSEYDWKGNENIDLFADIQGIWTYDISDKTTNIGIEWAKLIGTEIIAILTWMVSMWIGTYAVNTAVYWTRAVKWLNYLYKTWEIANKSFSTLNMWGKALKVWRFAAMSTIEGWSFYAGYAFMQSWIEGKNMYSTEWLYQSVAFMWAFKALNWLYKAAWLTLDATKPLMQQKLILGKQLLWEGITFSALWLSFEWILFEPGEWTAETIIQAFVMAAAFKWAWITAEKFKYRLNKENKVEAVEQEVWEVFIHKNWKEYIKWADWKYRDTDGRIRNVAEKNLRKKVSYTWSTEAPIDKNAKTLNPDGTKTKPEFNKNTIEKNKWLNEPLPNAKDIIEKEIIWIKKWEYITIWEYKIERSTDWKIYNLYKNEIQIESGVNIKKISESINNDFKTNKDLFSFLNKWESISITNKFEKLKWTEINKNLKFSTDKKGEIVDRFWKKVEFDTLTPETQAKIIEKITWFDLMTTIKNLSSNFKSSLSEEWKKEFKTKGWENWLIKKIFKDYWDFIKKWEQKDYSDHWIQNSALIIPKTAVYLPVRWFQYSKFDAYNFKNLRWPLASKEWRANYKKILAWTFALSTISEIAQGEDKSLYEKSTDVIYNTILYSTWWVYLWTLWWALNDSLIWYIGWYDERHFWASYIDNLLSNNWLSEIINLIPWVEIPLTDEIPYSAQNILHNTKEEIKKKMDNRFNTP